MISKCLFLFLLIIIMIYINKKQKGPQKNNLILGAIRNLQWDKIQVFFMSLMKANFEYCDFVMFVLNLSNETIDNIHNCGVKTIEIPEKYRI